MIAAADSLFHRLRQAPYETATGKSITLGPTVTSPNWEVTVQLNDGTFDEGKANVVDVQIRPRSEAVQFDAHSVMMEPGVTFGLDGSKLAELGQLLIETQRTLEALGMAKEG